MRHLLVTLVLSFSISLCFSQKVCNVKYKTFLMSKADANSDLILTVPKGSVIEAGQLSGGFYEAKVEGQFGYVQAVNLNCDIEQNTSVNMAHFDNTPSTYKANISLSDVGSDLSKGGNNLIWGTLMQIAAMGSAIFLSSNDDISDSVKIGVPIGLVGIGTILIIDSGSKIKRAGDKLIELDQ